ncbi:MAG: Mur ligase family protein [Synergistaceae bacterium]|nr:Mur ligase family protein [Synergistaceae bacterium]
MREDYDSIEKKLSQMASPGIRPGLARLARLLREAGMPQEKFTAVHIVGTNGKGSAAAAIYSALRASGYSAALYTSPHLVDFSERLMIDGECAPAQSWLAAIDEIERVIEKNPFFEDNRPTYFELVTAAAILIIARERPEAAVFEAGMGGRLDASNILKDVALSLITPIGLDHTEYLGESLEEVAAEKFAVMRRGVPALFFGGEGLNRQFREAAARQGAEAHIFSEEYRISNRRSSLKGNRFTLTGGGEVREYFTPLAGTFQAENAALAAAALKLLSRRFPRITEESAARGIAAAEWPGRMELLRDDPPLLLDGGHNPHAMRRLAETMEEISEGRPFNIVLAMMRDKDIETALGCLRRLNAVIFCTEVPGSERSLSAEEMKGAAERAGLTARGPYREPERALAKASAGGVPAICCGSLFLVGYMKRKLNEL